MEINEFTRIKVPKRKNEWLSSRFAVKQLIKTCVPQLAQSDLSQIQILKEPSGVPYIGVGGSTRLPGWLSFSHSHEYVLAAYSPDDIRFGVDLEYIEHRSEDFVRDFFTNREIEQALSGSQQQNSLITTIIWSAKEAFLKAISEGLRLDTRNIEIQSILNIFQLDDWHPVEIRSTAVDITATHLAWRKAGDFIQTICILDPQDQEWVWLTDDRD